MVLFGFIYVVDDHSSSQVDVLDTFYVFELSQVGRGILLEDFIEMF